MGVDAIGLPVPFTDCAKVIASGGAPSYFGGDKVMVLHRFDPVIVLLS